MQLIYTTKKFAFDSPESMQEKMIEYFKFVNDQNADFTQKFCKACGTIWTKETVQCCDNSDVEYKLIHKPTYEHTRPTMYGLAAFCGIAMSTLQNYKNKEGFDEVLEWFKTVLQMDLEQLLLNPFNRNVGGAKFVAVNNFGWKDKQFIEQTGAQQVTFINDIGMLELENNEESN